MAPTGFLRQPTLVVTGGVGHEDHIMLDLTASDRLDLRDGDTITAPDAVRRGNPLWRVEVIVARPDDEALTLPFCVPEYRMAEVWRPSPGDCVKGRAWVQGYLLALACARCPAGHSDLNEVGYA